MRAAHQQAGIVAAGLTQCAAALLAHMLACVVGDFLHSCCPEVPVRVAHSLVVVVVAAMALDILLTCVLMIAAA